MTQLIDRPRLSARRPRVLKAIFYDAGGTLLDTIPTVEDFTARVARSLGTDVDPDRLRRAFPDLYGFISLHEAARGGRGSAWQSDAGVRDLWVDFYLQAFRKAGIRAPEPRLREVAQQAYAWYMEPHVWRPFADATPALEAGKRAELIQGVISDWGTELLDILSHLDLTRHLDLVVSSAVVGWAKPHPEIFLHALARARVQPGEAVYVGDFYVNDILGARSVGIEAILLDREGTAPVVDCPVITSLAELLTLLGIVG